MYETIFADLTNTFSEVPMPVAALRMATALVFGAVIGLEREWRTKPAGLRTHMLISLAACIFILVAFEITALDFGSNETKRVDPLRLIEAVTAGVAFLAAGAIFTSGGTVKNLTTGASMWLAGAIGLCCGAGRIPLAVLATVLALLVLTIVTWVEKQAPLDSEEQDD
ncbi:MgtC/SapB family protein [Sulfitobacter sp. G21635-S1]|uniref:MgtC/SapB family protein n=1 Tax=Sulfitobacter sp. G21635-S1 TaxID=3014043 RepID=UPI0022AE574F|nr:MgtC/SapB family protein [Sulfitobacter sp. G21635-S1]MCZ4256103.1 MgtC/SapB family protein [Sulfitobacter sp. G21635-S1]